MNRFGWQGEGFGDTLQKEKDRLNYKDYYTTFMCDVCGKSRRVGNHIRCSEVRKKRGKHGQT